MVCDGRMGERLRDKVQSNERRSSYLCSLDSVFASRDSTSCAPSHLAIASFSFLLLSSGGDDDVIGTYDDAMPKSVYSYLGMPQEFERNACARLCTSRTIGMHLVCFVGARRAEGIHVPLCTCNDLVSSAKGASST